MAELAREGVALAPTEISECFCNLEGVSGYHGDGTSRRRKTGGRAALATSMLLHLSPKQLLVARKPTLMEDLITRNKTALLLNNMERSRTSKNRKSEVDSDAEPVDRSRGSKSRKSEVDSDPEPMRAGKNKRSEVDSDPEPLAIKRLRTNEPLKAGRQRKPSEDRKMRVSTRRFNASSLRSGKKRSHVKEALSIKEDKRKRVLKSSGTRSNDSETDSTSSTKTNGHLEEKPIRKVVEKLEKKIVKAKLNVAEASNSKVGPVRKIIKSLKNKTDEPVKKIRKKRRKADSMNWIKTAKQKALNRSKLASETIIKTEPLGSEPEDSGLGSEIKLDLTKGEDKPATSDVVLETLKNEPDNCENSCSDVITTSGNHVWNIESFQPSPFKDSSSICPQEAQPRNEEESPVPTSFSPVSPENNEITDQCIDRVNEAPEACESSFDPPKIASEEETCVSREVQEENECLMDHDESVNITVCAEVVTKPPDVIVNGDLHNQDGEELEAEIEVPTDSGQTPSPDSEQTPPPDSGKTPPPDSGRTPLPDSEQTPPPDSEPTPPPVESEVDKAYSDPLETLLNNSETQIDSLTDTDNITEDVTDIEPDVLTSEPSPNPIPEDQSLANLSLPGIDASNLSPEQVEETALITDVVSEEQLIAEQIEEEDHEESGEVLTMETETDIMATQSEVISIETTRKTVDLLSITADVPIINQTEENDLVEADELASTSDQLDINGICDKLELDEEVKLSSEICENGEVKTNGVETLDEIISSETEKTKKPEGVEQQAMKADWLKALGLQSLRPMPGGPPLLEKDFKEEKPSKAMEPGYTTGTLKAVIKLNKGAPRSIVFKNNEDSKADSQQTPEEPVAASTPESGINRKPKEGLLCETDSSSLVQVVSGATQGQPSESDEDKVHGKESNLIIPEKSSSFSIHPGRLCCDVCCYCFGKFGSLDTPCHIAQLKGEERQQKILQNEPYLTVDSCLCDACYRYVDRKANCPSSAAAKTAKRARPPAATLCCVTDCTLTATHSVKRKWLLKIKRSLANKFEIDMEKHTSVFNPLCSNHHYWVDYYMVCGICRKRLNRNHLYTLGPETDKLNLVLAEDGIPARLSDKLFLCKLCRYYANMRLKYSDPTTIPPSSQPFYVNYRKKILSSLDVPVSDSDEDKPAKTAESKDEDVMSLSGLATLLSDQPEQQPRIQVKFGNVNIGTLSNLNIGQGSGRQEERPTFDRNDPSNLPLNASFDFQGPSTSDGAWEKVTSTLQFDKKTKQLWQELQRPYGNQSSFLRHLVMLEKYWRCGYLVLSDTADPRTTKYLTSVQTRNKSFEGTEVKAIKVEPQEPSSTTPLQEPVIKVPDPSRRQSMCVEETKPLTPAPEPPKRTPGGFLMPTGEVEVLPVNPNRNVPKEKPISKGTVIIQRPSVSQPPTTQHSPCKIMITSVQSLAKPKVDPVLLHRAKSLVRMVAPTPSPMRQLRPTMPTPIQRMPRMARPRQPIQFMQQSYQTLQAQLQTPPQNNPLQSLHQVVGNRYPPPPLVKINQQMNQQGRVGTPRPLSPGVRAQRQQSVGSLIQQLNQPVVSMQGFMQQRQQPAVSFIQQPSLTSLKLQSQQNMMQQIQQAKSDNIMLQIQQAKANQQIQQIKSDNMMQQIQQAKANQQVKSNPPPYRPLLPKLPSSLSISTTPQSTTPNLTPSVSLLPPTSSGPANSISGTLPSVSTLTSLRTPPPYTTTSQTPCVSILPATPSQTPSVSILPASCNVSLPSSITLPSSGITIEKQPHNFSTPPVLPPEKPIISVFREPLPTQDT